MRANLEEFIEALHTGTIRKHIEHLTMLTRFSKCLVHSGQIQIIPNIPRKRRNLEFTTLLFLWP